MDLLSEAGIRVAATFDFLDRLVAEEVRLAVQASTLRLALERGRQEAEREPLIALLQLTLAVHAGAAGDWRPAVPAAAACHLLYLGADLLDNVNDQELPGEWQTWGPDQAVLTACNLLYPLSQLALKRVAAPPEVRQALSVVLAEGALRMAAGQQEEVFSSRDPAPDPERCLAAVAAKTGAEAEACCRAGAVLVDAPAPEADAYAAFGRLYGTAVQLISDCQDIWGKKNSPDLANGRRTLPVVHALWSASGSGRVTLLRLLNTPVSLEQQAGVRDFLTSHGSLIYCALRASALRREAAGHLQMTRGTGEPFLAALLDRLRIV